MFAGKKSAQIREILISESAWEEMTCLFAPSLVDRVFTLMPVRTRVDSNKLLIKTMLKNPTLSKASCCLQVDKYPTHYSRLSNTLSEHCAWVGLLSGGRNPMKLLRGIRGDL
ncbi:hypothetical protein EB413_19845 [Salmonella enterica]|nr:hypothetical protein [Salmonella enterica]